MRYARLTLLLSLLLISGVVANGGQRSVEGTWWLRASAGDGVLLLELSEEEGALIPAAGAGWCSDLGGIFLVDPDGLPGLTFDFRGRMTGKLVLVDPDLEEPIGTLEIADGRIGEARERIQLKVSIVGEDETTTRATFRGGRLPEDAPDWTGRTPDGRLRGGGIRSRKYTIEVSESLLGFPFLDLDGAGPALVDGEEKDLEFTGLLIAAPNGRLFGSVEFDVGECVAQGRIREVEAGCRLRLALCPPDRKRLKIMGRLDPTVVPEPETSGGDDEEDGGQ